MSQVFRAAQRALRTGGGLNAATPFAARQQVRGMGGGHGHGHGETYAGLTLHEPASWHKTVGEGLAGLCWFWIFYRFSKDGSTLLFGHAQHFEHDDDIVEEKNKFAYKPPSKH